MSQNVLGVANEFFYLTSSRTSFEFESLVELGAGGWGWGSRFSRFSGVRKPKIENRVCFCLVSGFRFSPSRFPGLGPTQGPWPVHVSCVEACTQFAFHRSCTPRHARVRAHGNVFVPRVNMRNRAAFKARLVLSWGIEILIDYCFCYFAAEHPPPVTQNSLLYHPVSGGT